MCILCNYSIADNKGSKYYAIYVLVFKFKDDCCIIKPMKMKAKIPLTQSSTGTYYAYNV